MKVIEMLNEPGEMTTDFFKTKTDKESELSCPTPPLYLTQLSPSSKPWDMLGEINPWGAMTPPPPPPLFGRNAVHQESMAFGLFLLLNRGLPSGILGLNAVSGCLATGTEYLVTNGHH